MSERPRDRSVFVIPDALIDTGTWARLPLSAAKVYQVFKRHADSEGYCYLSIRRLAELSGLSKAGVALGRDDLIRARLLETVKLAPRGRRKALSGEWEASAYRVLDYLWREAEKSPPGGLSKGLPGGHSEGGKVHRGLSESPLGRTSRELIKGKEYGKGLPGGLSGREAAGRYPPLATGAHPPTPSPTHGEGVRTSADSEAPPPPDSENITTRVNSPPPSPEVEERHVSQVERMFGIVPGRLRNIRRLLGLGGKGHENRPAVPETEGNQRPRHGAESPSEADQPKGADPEPTREAGE